MEEEKKVFKRVKVPVQKWALAVVIISGLVLAAFSIFLLIANPKVPIIGIVCLILAVVVLILPPISIIKDIKKSQQTNTFPEEAIVLYDGYIEVVTDKTETIYFSQIKSVRGVRFVTTGAFSYKYYFFGNLTIKLVDGKKIVLKGIDQVLSVAKELREKIK